MKLPKMDKIRLGKIVARQVSFFRGWYVSDETMQKACEKAAENVLRAVSARLACPRALCREIDAGGRGPNERA